PSRHPGDFVEATSGPSFTLRWSAPEILQDTTGHTEASDVYALGMTIYETVTGKVPYHGKSDTAVIQAALVNKEHPERPEVMLNDKTSADDLWSLLTMCWSFEPLGRPSVSDVLKAVGTGCLIGNNPPSPCVLKRQLGRIRTISILSRQMDAREVISRLVARGCDDLSDSCNHLSFSEHPTLHGGLSDIYQGQLLDGRKVAVKVLRVSLEGISQGSKHLKRAARELHTWNKCGHPNIMPLLGLAAFRDRIGMVSLWMKNGSLPRYLKAMPDVNRYHMSVQICQGLSYLHQNQIVCCVHLPGSRILIGYTRFTAT
ncbi:unnamed protein product, partial [Rhizoctonia solani]